MKNLAKLGKVLSSKEQKSVTGGDWYDSPHLSGSCGCDQTLCTALAPKGHYGVCRPCKGGGRECHIYFGFPKV